MLEERSTSSSPLNVRVANERSSATPSHRGRLAIVGVALLAMSILVGGAGWNNTITNWADLTKVIAVALFVAAMVALAMGMIGDSFRRG